MSVDNLVARKQLIDVLGRRGMLNKKDGRYEQYTEQIFAYWDDRVPVKDVLEILHDDYPMDRFEQWIDGVYDEYVYDKMEEVVNEALESMELVYPEEEVNMSETLRDELYELLVFDLPYDHYLDIEYEADLMIDTGDANFDFSCNSVYPHYYGEKGSGIEKEASLVWLAETQGYTKKELENALDEGDVSDPDGFLDTVRQEVANETSGMNCLTFLVRMKLRDLIELNKLIRLQEPGGEKFFDVDLRPDCGTLKISKEADVGLYDPWNGAGSVFEIVLEKDIILPIKYIRSCLPDEEFRWSVKSVYAMCGSAWKDVVSEIKGPEEK